MFQKHHSDIRLLGARRLKRGKCSTGETHTGCYRTEFGYHGDLAPGSGAHLFHWFLANLTMMFHVLGFEVTIS